MAPMIAASSRMGIMGLVPQAQQQARQHGADEEGDQRGEMPAGVRVAALGEGDAGQHRVAGHVGGEHAAHGDVAHRVGDAGDDGEQRRLDLRPDDHYTTS